MNKKTQKDGRKTYDGPNQSAGNVSLFMAVAGNGFVNPNMGTNTLKKMLDHVKKSLMTLAGGETKATLILTDSLHLLEALAIRFGDLPIAEVVDTLMTEGYEEWEAKKKEEAND